MDLKFSSPQRLLTAFISVQVLAIAVAAVAFSVFEDPKIAGQLTGPLFLISGLLPLMAALFRKFPWAWPAVIVSIVMTLGFSLPMLVVRYMAMGTDFVELRFFGLPAPLFHRLSGIVFLMLIASEIYQLYKIRAKSQ